MSFLHPEADGHAGMEVNTEKGEGREKERLEEMGRTANMPVAEKQLEEK